MILTKYEMALISKIQLYDSKMSLQLVQPEIKGTQITFLYLENQEITYLTIKKITN